MRFANTVAVVSWLGFVGGCLAIGDGDGRPKELGGGALQPDSGPTSEPDSGPTSQPDSGSTVYGTTCSIDGVTYASRALNPANLGQCCNPITSPNAWLPLLSPGIVTTAIGGPNDGVIADFNGDGFPDVAVTTSSPENVYVYMGLPDGSGYASPFTYAAGAWPIDVTAGDMNGDGLPDLVVGSGDAVAVLLSNGDGTFGDPLVTAASCQVGPLRIADINQDGFNDVVSANPACGVSIFLGLGTGALSAPSNLAISGPNQIEVADVNGDGAPDIITTNSDIVVALNDGRGSFSTITTTNLSNAQGFAEHPGFAVGAFSGGAPQVAATTQTDLVLMSIGATTGSGTVVSQASLDTWGQRAVALDLNGDGLPDVVSFGYPGLGISINLGSSTFASSVDVPLSGIQMIAAGDLNGDGAPDILVMYGAAEGDNGNWVQYLNSCP